MARKTVKLLDLVTRVNDYNRSSTGPDTEQRRVGKNVLIGILLQEANAYAGFYYLGTNEVPTGEAPGIAVDAKGDNVFPDTSRLAYYTHKLA